MRRLSFFLSACAFLMVASSSFASESPTQAPSASTSTAEQSAVPANLTPISTGKYVASGIVGTLAGYGVGHMVQGTWQDFGWVFTLTEGLGLVSMFNAQERLNHEDIESMGDVSRSYAVKVLLGSEIAIVALHGWEIYDIWTRPVRINRQRYVGGSSLELLPALAADGKPEALLAWGYQF